MRIRLPFIAWGLTLSISACGPAEPSVASDRPSVERDSAGVRIVESRAPLRERLPTIAGEPALVIGGGSGGADDELYRVRAALPLANGGVLVANGGTAELRWYSDTGELVRRAGSTGRGPGELMFLSQVFLLPGDTVAAFDVQLRRLSFFDGEGAFVRSEQLDDEAPFGLAPVARFEDGRFLMATGFAFTAGGQGPTRIERPPLEVFRSGAEGIGALEHLLDVPGIEMVIAPTGGLPRRDGSEIIGQTPRPFFRNTTVTGHSAGWIVADNDRAEVRFLSPEGAVTRIARWQVEARPVTSADVEARRAERLGRQEDPAVRQRLMDAWDRHPPPPETMPFFGSALVDPMGNVWLEEYVPAAEGEANRYELFDASGVWIGTVQVPPGVRVLSIGADALVGLRTDELGVETVAVYRLERP